MGGIEIDESQYVGFGGYSMTELCSSIPSGHTDEVLSSNGGKTSWTAEQARDDFQLVESR